MYDQCLSLTNYRGISSVKGELVPHLVRHQGVAMEHTYTNQTKQGRYVG